jgi:hypothetical protein
MVYVRSAMLFGGGDNFLAVLFHLYAISDALVKPMPGKPMTLELCGLLERGRGHPRARVTTARSSPTVAVNSSR